MSQPLEYEQVTYNASDGAQMGRTSTELIGFYGAVPQSQYALVGAASTYASFQQSTASASTWGFASAAAVTSLVYQVSTLTVALRNLGLIA
jgi:hypothetical protein